MMHEACQKEADALVLEASLCLKASDAFPQFSLSLLLFVYFALQAAIRKELNDFKSNEMEVHESSRHLTRYDGGRKGLA